MSTSSDLSSFVFFTLSYFVGSSAWAIQRASRTPLSHPLQSFDEGLTEEKPKEPFDEPKSRKTDEIISPFEEIATRAPVIQNQIQTAQQARGGYGSSSCCHQYVNPILYNVYPIFYPKDQTYCPNMRGMFYFTCQPSKPLRWDLLEFCKEYSAHCNVPNFHRWPGPRMGPPLTDRSVGNVGVSGNFGFGIGVVPGLDVKAGWGVDVGPIPYMGDSVGVNLDTNVGILGANPPELVRRGMIDPSERGRGGILGLSSGVGVQTPGAGNVGVGSGIGVG